MSFFKNLKMRTKLTISFIFIALFIGMVGFVGSSDIKKVKHYSDLIAIGNVQPLDQMGGIRQNFMQIKYDMLLLRDPNNNGDIKALENDINKLREEDNKLVKAYDDVPASGLSSPTIDLEGKAYEEFQASLPKYRDASNKIIALVKDGKYAEAKEQFKTFESVENEVQKELTTIVQCNIKEVQERQDLTNGVVKSSLTVMNSLFVLGMFLAVLLGYLLSSMISRNLAKVTNFAEKFGDGDLTQNINITSKDEIGVLSYALNKALNNIKELVQQINASAEELSSTSEELSASMEEITAQMDSVNNSTEQIAAGSENVSSIVEEVNASVEDINSITQDLSLKSDMGNKSSKEISVRAAQVKNSAISSVKVAEETHRQILSNALSAIEKGKVVEQIKIMADSIGSIAEQTNLLALNAAIEAARAGEQGRGFAVVAEEVRKLAEQSSESVSNIHNVVSEVGESFNDLSNNMKKVLEFIDNTVQPDYKHFVQTGDQYEKDANLISSMAGGIDSAAKHISNSISQVLVAIQSVSETAQESASRSEEILSNINETSRAVGDLAKSAQDQSQLAEKLNNLILKFKM